MFRLIQYYLGYNVITLISELFIVDLLLDYKIYDMNVLAEIGTGFWEI